MTLLHISLWKRQPTLVLVQRWRNLLKHWIHSESVLWAIKERFASIFFMMKTRKKTAVVKDNGSPMFNEEFDFDIDHEDVPKHQLKITVVDKKGVFAKSPVLGTVDINLDNPGLSHGLAGWYPLEDLDEDSD